MVEQSPKILTSEEKATSTTVLLEVEVKQKGYVKDMNLHINICNCERATHVLPT